MLQMDDRAKNFCLALKIVVFDGNITQCSLEQWLSTVVHLSHMQICVSRSALSFQVMPILPFCAVT